MVLPVIQMIFRQTADTQFLLLLNLTALLKRLQGAFMKRREK
jgi:hypothetical protein